MQAAVELLTPQVDLGAVVLEVQEQLDPQELQTLEEAVVVEQVTILQEVPVVLVLLLSNTLFFIMKLFQ